MIQPDQDYEELVVFSGGGAGGVGQWEHYKHWCRLGFKGSQFGGTSAGCLNALFAARGLHELADTYYAKTYDGTAATVFGSELMQIRDGRLKLDPAALKDTILKGINIWDAPKLFSKRGQKALTQQLFSNVLGIQSLLNNKPLLAAVKEVLSTTAPQYLPFRFNVVNMITGLVERHEASDFQDIDMLALAIVASTTIPVVLPLVPGYNTKQGSFKQLGDGGLRDGSPVGQMLKSLDPTKRQRITVFNINRREISTAKELGSMITVAGRTLQILLNEVLIGDLENVLERNKIARMYGEQEGYRHVPIRIIEASHNRSVFDFTRESYDEQVLTAPGDVNRQMEIEFL